MLASRDVIVDGGGAARSAEGYEYVARRPLAIVALAEARAIPLATARVAIDQLADSLASCVAQRPAVRAQPLAQGAARVVAQVDTNGVVMAANVRVDSRPGATESAVLCLVVPIKLLVFPPVDGGARGFAIEALWGRLP